MTRILHISDIHIGRKFNGALWEDMILEATALSPDLIVITGDVVNTPWRWALRRAAKHILKLRNDLRTQLNKPDLACVLVPGNHDTRIMGLFPVRSLTLFSVISLGFAVLCIWYTSLVPSSPIWRIVFDLLTKIFVIFFICSCALRALVSTRLRKAFGSDVFIQGATKFESLGVGIIPFDSASKGVANWARGFVDTSQFTKCRSTKNSPALTWIAAVHHHPLPLPYDSAHEPMMVMDNAGAFLRELGQYGVKLVLHGHKHHQHFARIAVDPAHGQSLDVSVLSAGTPTEGLSAGNWHHGFNVIDVEGDGRCRIEMFEAKPGGTFASVRKFDMRTNDAHNALRYETNKQTLPLSVREINWSVVIDESGDAMMSHEFIGLTAREASVEKITDAVHLQARTGCFERMSCVTTDRNGPGLSLAIRRQPRPKTVNLPVSAGQPVSASYHDEQYADIVFKGGDGLHPDHGPIDVPISVFANNAFALNGRECREMYQTADDSQTLVFRTLPVIALEQLNALVRFPESIDLPQRIDLSVRDKAGVPWIPLPPHEIHRVRGQNAVMIRALHPSPGSEYRLSWDVDGEELDDLSDEQEFTLSKIEAVVEHLASVTDAATKEKIFDVIDAIRAEAEVELGAPSDARYEVALYVYVKSEACLRVIASNYKETDPRRDWRYRFGDGIVGRSYRTRQVIAFQKSSFSKQTEAFRYQRGDGVRVEQRSDIPEARILAFPVSVEGAEDWPFAVLQFSTDDPMVRLQTSDTKEKQPIANLLTSLNQLLYVQLESCV